MADRESTAVGYRLRMQPPDLSTYPDSVKLQWFEWVTELGIERKLVELRKGWDRYGKTHPLKPRTIKYRKSEVGPVHKRAPRGIPALDLSRVMSLLTGRAHLSSAEFWWGFDSVTGASFARILHYWADDHGHDVFGLSPAGTAWVEAEAMKKWAEWKAAGGYTRPAVNLPGAKPVRKAAIRRPIRKIEIPGRMDLENMDLAGGEAEIRRAIAAGRFPGFRRLNLRGEQWKPGAGIPHLQPPPKFPPKPPPPTAPPKPAPVPKPPPSHSNPHIATAIDMARAAGVAHVNVIDFDQARAIWKIKVDAVQASYDYKTGEILINGSHPIWKDPAAQMAKSKGWLSTDSITHTIEHELAHREHHLAIGTHAFAAMVRAREEPEGAKEIAAVVSRYASKLKVEFVAETRVGLAHGKKYHPEIIALYKSYGGVMP
ncbi:MAG TPA: hypothetical protein VKF17_16865 [Isosphaeraceae bacterium]|nr:hypothetical protein [Isosphaeraceae bacterium]